MIYTQSRRRAMNKATRALYPDTKFHESADGVPVMECTKLPTGIKRIDSAEDFLRRVNNQCVRINDMGTPIPDYGKALPVFIRSMELGEKGARDYYRVNYVSISECSQRMAAQYIAEGKLYAVM